MKRVHDLGIVVGAHDREPGAVGQRFDRRRGGHPYAADLPPRLPHRPRAVDEDHFGAFGRDVVCRDPEPLSAHRDDDIDGCPAPGQVGVLEDLDRAGHTAVARMHRGWVLDTGCVIDAECVLRASPRDRHIDARTARAPRELRSVRRSTARPVRTARQSTEHLDRTTSYPAEQPGGRAQQSGHQRGGRLPERCECVGDPPQQCVHRVRERRAHHAEPASDGLDNGLHRLSQQPSECRDASGHRAANRTEERPGRNRQRMRPTGQHPGEAAQPEEHHIDATAENPDGPLRDGQAPFQHGAQGPRALHDGERETTRDPREHDAHRSANGGTGSNDRRCAADDQVGRGTRDLTQPPDDPQRRRDDGGQDSCADTEAGTAVGIARGRDRRRESSARTKCRVGLVVSVRCRGVRHRASVAATTRGDDGGYERFASPKSEPVLAPG